MRDVTGVVYELVEPEVLVPRRAQLDPAGLAADEILAKTEYTVVSPGTEIAAWRGDPPLRPSATYPRLVGYCNLAQIVAVGSEVTDLSVGDRVLTHESHRSAFISKRSAVLLRVTENDEPTRKLLTATYLYQLGYAALLAGGMTPGHVVAVVGFGALGIATANLVKVFGGVPLIFTNQEASTTPALTLALEDVHPKAPLPQAFFEARFEMDGVDIAIDTSNAWSDLRLCMELTRKGGKVVCLGFPGRGGDMPDFNPLDPQYFYDKQLSVHHCGYMPDLEAEAQDVRFTLKRSMRFLADLIVRGSLNPQPILSIEASWADLGKVYRMLDSKSAGQYSAVIAWSS
jgi:2-desacetyl-2-hydroxyethyl bacteriochlorophyllide A dehydrogenase